MLPEGFPLNEVLKQLWQGYRKNEVRAQCQLARRVSLVCTEWAEAVKSGLNGGQTFEHAIGACAARARCQYVCGAAAIFAPLSRVAREYASGATLYCAEHVPQFAAVFGRVLSRLGVGRPSCTGPRRVLRCGSCRRGLCFDICACVRACVRACVHVRLRNARRA